MNPLPARLSFDDSSAEPIVVLGLDNDEQVFSTKENQRGLGLTLVQEILSRHDFAFSLESPPDDPTRFTIRF